MYGGGYCRFIAMEDGEPSARDFLEFCVMHGIYVNPYSIEAGKISP
jgi:hypothetical protein